MITCDEHKRLRNLADHGVDLDDLDGFFGASGEAWRFQRVKFPHRQGERAAPPGIEPWAHEGNDMG
jgi:uncharacterized DUF497 family protein